jgi:hypothetical protein
MTRRWLARLEQVTWRQAEAFIQAMTHDELIAWVVF